MLAWFQTTGCVGLPIFALEIRVGVLGELTAASGVLTLGAGEGDLEEAGEPVPVDGDDTGELDPVDGDFDEDGALADAFAARFLGSALLLPSTAFEAA